MTITDRGREADREPATDREGAPGPRTPAGEAAGPSGAAGAAEEDGTPLPRAQAPAGDGSHGGGISIGVLTGGAVAAGDRASAEDRSLRDGHTAPPLPPTAGTEALAVPGSTPGGISVGVMAGGAAAAGPDARALDASTRSAVEASPELRAALSTLREQLPLLNTSDETAEIDARLADAEEEIDATGQVRRDRLQWLRDRLELGATAVAGLASAATVVQQITQLLGGQG
ncbi:hypothetical protein [Streptomyces noursei]|uniref:hypothetical protein n=1 Tax=Streptomyces noursei TaxID=1971 RepID=UPI00167C35A9|nr:hypothetical protein [Streptomyces noursei]MCZ1020508.1 hypothetical protein [Streptomyces noursei]GGX13244.1 hypothetical protein GCM10010341_38480 [Streptomyces noursei]